MRRGAASTWMTGRQPLGLLFRPNPIASAGCCKEKIALPQGKSPGAGRGASHRRLRCCRKNIPGPGELNFLNCPRIRPVVHAAAAAAPGRDRKWVALAPVFRNIRAWANSLRDRQTWIRCSPRGLRPRRFNQPHVPCGGRWVADFSPSPGRYRKTSIHLLGRDHERTPGKQDLCRDQCPHQGG